MLILTAKDALDERVAGLDAGADDYMTKPFALAELSARLRALLRRGAPRESVLHVADLEMDTIRRKVRRAGKAIDLKPKEYALLEFLMRNTDRPLDQGLDHRARVGHPFRQRQQRRRGPHQLLTEQDRQRIRRPPYSHHPGSRVRPDGYAVVTLTLRTRLAAISTVSAVTFLV